MNAGGRDRSTFLLEPWKHAIMVVLASSWVLVRGVSQPEHATSYCTSYSEEKETRLQPLHYCKHSTKNMKYSSPLVAVVAVSLLLFQPFIMIANASLLRHSKMSEEQEEEVIHEEADKHDVGEDEKMLAGFGKFQKEETENDVDAKFDFDKDDETPTSAPTSAPTPIDRCQTLELYVLSADTVVASPSNGVTTYRNPSVYDSGTDIVVGEFVASCIADGLGDATCNDVFSFYPLDVDFLFPNQIYVSASFLATSGAITGGTGVYTCASGTWDFDFSDPIVSSYVLTFCVDPDCF
jgi:hypothetical protein